jgi:hypothetical protein
MVGFLIAKISIYLIATTPCGPFEVKFLFIPTKCVKKVLKAVFMVHCNAFTVLIQVYARL